MPENSDNKLVFLAFLLIFLLLLLLYLPSFSNPPQCDWWEAFSVFHQLRYTPFSAGLPFLVNHDPWRHGTFRPLSYTTLFLEHRLFGGALPWYHLTNLALYCLVLILLYLLGKKLGGRPAVLIASLALFALLFSHCDILTLTFHVFLIAGFAAFLLAFLIYLRFLESGGRILPGVIVLLFISGMFSYEIFIFWPLSVILLAFLFRPAASRRRLLLSTAVILAAVYSIYGAVFIATRACGYNSGRVPGAAQVHLLAGTAFTFFNLIYTGAAVNLCPFLAQPVLYKGYSEMSGLIPPGTPPGLIRAAYLIGGAALALIGLGLRRLYRVNRRTASALFFLLFLYFSSFLLLMTARSITNSYSHVLRQFRYQYIPNALIALAAALLVSSRRSSPRWARNALLCIFLTAFIFNYLLVSRHINNVDKRLSPLKELIVNIREGINSGKITPRRPLYLPDSTPTYFPHLCWNRSMGRKMRGTYQWIFSPRQLYTFTPSRRKAYWVVDPKNRNYHLNSMGVWRYRSMGVSE